MSDNATSYIGIGKSIQGKADMFPGLLFRKQAIDAANAKPKQEKLINLDDFKIQSGEMYPLFATQQAKVIAQAANDYRDIEQRVGDPIKARNIWEQNKSKYQQQIYSLESSNETAKKILTDKSFYYGMKPQLANAVIQNDMNGEDFAKLLHNPDQGSFATPTFGFNADLVKDNDLAALAQSENKNPVMDTNPKNARKQPIPGSNGQFMYQYPMNVDQRDVQNASNKLLTDPDNIKLLQRKYGLKFDGATDDERLNNQRIAATKFAQDNMTSSYSTPINVHPTKEPEAEKKKAWSSDGSTLRNDKNVISVSQIGETDIPKMVGLPDLAKNPNIKVLTYSHTDAGENKPLLFVDEKGTPVGGVLRGGIVDVSNPANDKVVVESGGKFVLLSNTAINRDVVKNEYGKTFEEAVKELGSKTGTQTNTVGQKEVKTGSSSGIEEFTVSGKKYRIPKDKVAEFKKDMGL